MADQADVPGGAPVDQFQPVSVDNETIQGNGTPTHPLFVVPDAIEIVTDDVTIGGTGKGSDPLHAIFTGFYDKVKVVADGTTIVGTGITGDPLIATGGAPGSTHVQPFTYTVVGTEPDLANLTIPVVPGQPDGTYQVVPGQGSKHSFLTMSIDTKTGANFVLHLSAPAQAGDTFDFILARAA